MLLYVQEGKERDMETYIYLSNGLKIKQMLKDLDSLYIIKPVICSPDLGPTLEETREATVLALYTLNAELRSQPREDNRGQAGSQANSEGLTKEKRTNQSPEIKQQKKKTRKIISPKGGSPTQYCLIPVAHHKITISSVSLCKILCSADLKTGFIFLKIKLYVSQDELL